MGLSPEAEATRALWDRGDPAGAEQAYRLGLAISETLAAQNPDDTDLQRDLSSNHDRIGDIRRDQDDRAGAEAAYRVSLTIRQVLAELENGSVQAELALAVSHNRLALVSQDPRPDLRAALAVPTRLRDQGRLPPANAGWIDLVEGDLASLPP